MSFWSKPSTTTTLLAVIAGLLLILVVQNSMRPSAPPHPMMSQNDEIPFGHPPVGGEEGGQPSGGGGPSGEGMPENGPSGGGPGMQGNFDPTLMVMAALVCPDETSLTLDAQGCS